jgi:selenocysteine lyase/cysteine desulfurase
MHLGRQPRLVAFQAASYVTGVYLPAERLVAAG